MLPRMRQPSPVFWTGGSTDENTDRTNQSTHGGGGRNRKKKKHKWGDKKCKGTSLRWAVVIMALDREEDLTQQQRVHDRTRRLHGDQRTKKGKNLASAVRERTCPSREVRQTQSYHPYKSPLNTLGRIQERPRNPTYLFSDELSTVYPTSVPPMSMLFMFFYFFPRPLLHTAPLELFPGMQCGGGGAWSA